MTTEGGSDAATPVDRFRLEALRYAVGEEAAQYIAIMRVFTAGLTGLMSDQGAAEVQASLADGGFELDLDTVDARLSYLVEHGNLARSPREAEARTLADYLRGRARYQLTQRGELVHRHVEELLGHTESAREVSSQMLSGILAGLTALAGLDPTRLEAVDPDRLAGDITTVFAQFNELVQSTREFYTYLTQVLTRFDLDRGEFQLFKTALIDYLQRFVDEISRHMPQLADAIVRLSPHVPSLVAHADSGERLLDLHGRRARRSPGLQVEDWHSLRAWFAGDGDRESDADGVRHLATAAMRSLLTNLRRIASSHDREQGRYADLVRLAGWFDATDDDTAHALWAGAFGLYASRHLSFVADHPESPIPPTMSWWRSPRAEVPVMLRTQGKRSVLGRSAQREDFAVTKAARAAERAEAERVRAAAVTEILRHTGPLERVRISDHAREVLLDLYAAAMAAGVDGAAIAPIPGSAAYLVVRTAVGASTVVVSPAGRFTILGRSLEVRPEARITSGRSGEATG